MQIQSIDTASRIQNPQSYLNFIPLYDNLFEIYNNWPLGHPICTYNVINQYGSYSSDVLEFFLDGQIILLCRTLQQHNNNGLFLPRWELIAPLDNEIKYSRYLLDSNSEQQLLLFDDIYIAANINIDRAIPFWAGDYATMKNSSLKYLEGRKSIGYVYDQYNPNSIRYGAELLEKTDRLKIDVKLYPFNEINTFSITSNNGLGVMNSSSAQFQNQRQHLTRHLSNQSFLEVSRSDYFASAEQFHGLKLDIKKEVISVSHSPNNLHKTPHKMEYIVFNLIKKGNIALVYGGAKVGKSTFINDFGTMIAAGETFGNSNRWSVPHPQKVVIIDGEMPLDELAYKSEGGASDVYGQQAAYCLV